MHALGQLPDGKEMLPQVGHGSGLADHYGIKGCVVDQLVNDLARC